MARFFEDKFSDHFVEVNGLRLHYTDWGGDKPPLVLVHGYNVQLHSWDPIADMLRDDYRVICTDLRGHGDSDWSRAGYNVRDFVSDLHGIVQALGLGPFDLVGHSLGSRIAMMFAGEYPKALKHVIFSDNGPEPAPAWNPRSNTARREAEASPASAPSAPVADPRGFRSENDAIDHIRQQNPEWQPIFHEVQGYYQVRRNWADKLVWKSDPDLFWITGSAGGRENAELWEICSTLTVPALIMWGENSRLLNKDIVDRMLAAIPNVKLAQFPTGHQIWREQPETCVRALRDFLAS